jgi:hypothetical protein
MGDFTEWWDKEGLKMLQADGNVSIRGIANVAWIVGRGSSTDEAEALKKREAEALKKREAEALKKRIDELKPGEHIYTFTIPLDQYQRVAKENEELREENKRMYEELTTDG